MKLHLFIESQEAGWAAWQMYKVQDCETFRPGFESSVLCLVKFRQQRHFGLFCLKVNEHVMSEVAIFVSVKPDHNLFPEVCECLNPIIKKFNNCSHKNWMLCFKIRNKNVLW